MQRSPRCRFRFELQGEASGHHLRVGHKAAARTRAATLRALLERANPLAACVPRAALSAASALARGGRAAMAHDGRCIHRLANAEAQRGQGQEAREHASQQRRSKHASKQRRASCSTRRSGGSHPKFQLRQLRALRGLSNLCTKIFVSTGRGRRTDKKLCRCFGAAACRVFFDHLIT